MKIGYYSGQDIKNNVVYFLEKHAVQQPNKIAFYYASKNILGSNSHKYKNMTYRVFNTMVANLAGGLFRFGIKRGDRILVCAPISPELYIAIAGVQRIGAIPVLIDSISRQDQLIGIIKNSQPIGIISSGEWLKIFGPILNIFRIKISIDDIDNEKVIKLDNLVKEKPQEIMAVDKNDVALITYTTGSSGTPKGANRTHRFLSAQHYALKRLFPYKSNDIDLPVFPVFTLNNIASGVTTVIPAIDISKPNYHDSEILLHQIEDCQVNCMTLAPSSFRNLAIYCNEQNKKLNNISRVLTGGAPISEIDIKKFIAIAPNSENWILYGSTEVEPIACIESKEMLLNSPVKEKNITEIGVNVGKIDNFLNYKCINMDIDNVNKVIDIKDIEVDKGNIGELIVAGENVCDQYYNNEEAFTRTKIKDCNNIVWHRTGDLVRIDENNFLWIVGRKHNIIKYNNKYFFPVRPEIILKDLPNVVNAAYLSYKDDIVIAIVLQNDSEQKKDDCRKKIIKLFKEEQIPIDTIIFMTAIPMDVRHHSKIDYNKLREKLYEIL